MLQLPETDEYASYFGPYVRLMAEGDIVDIYAAQMRETLGLLAPVTEEKAEFRYAEGKWSLKEVIGHIADNERIMSYRLLWIARGLQAPLPGYDQEVMMGGGPFRDRSLGNIIEDYTAVRRATITLLRGLSAEAWTRRGTVSGNVMSARAMAYILAGHERHHLNVIREKYLV